MAEEFNDPLSQRQAQVVDDGMTSTTDVKAVISSMRCDIDKLRVCVQNAIASPQSFVLEDMSVNVPSFH